MWRGQLIPLSRGAGRRLGPSAGELWDGKHAPRDAALLREQRQDRTNPGNVPNLPLGWLGVGQLPGVRDKCTKKRYSGKAEAAE